MNNTQMKLILNKIQQDILTFKRLKMNGEYTLITHLKKCSNMCDLFRTTQYDDSVKIECMETYQQVLTHLLESNSKDEIVNEIILSHAIYFEDTIRNLCPSHLFEDLKVKWEKTILHLEPSLLNNAIRNLCLANARLETASNCFQSLIYRLRIYIAFAEYYIRYFESSKITNPEMLNECNQFYQQILYSLIANKKSLSQLENKY